MSEWKDEADNNGHKDVVALLLGHCLVGGRGPAGQGCRCDRRNGRYTNTPLQLATNYGCNDVLALLVTNGAQVCFAALSS